MKTVKRLLATAFVAATTTAAVWAAEVTEEASFGIISGQVTDAEQHTLPGATIQIESLHTGVTADINGFYKLPNLKPGTYTLKVTYVGYNPIFKKVTVTNANRVLVADIVMNEGVELSEVNVKGAFAGQRKALQMQKGAMGVTNVVSADQVGKFPDSNIGDALKRINGINVQYDQGEARFGQVRGTSADLTSVTVNGNRLPSAEGDTRNVQLDLIPAEETENVHWLLAEIA